LKQIFIHKIKSNQTAFITPFLRLFPFSRINPLTLSPISPSLSFFYLLHYFISLLSPSISSIAPNIPIFFSILLLHHPKHQLFFQIFCFSSQNLFFLSPQAPPFPLSSGPRRLVSTQPGHGPKFEPEPQQYCITTAN
jgi:hypothetical protein